MKLTGTLLVALPAVLLFAGEEPPGLPDALRRHVEYLASDRLQGRGNGTEGMNAAADYIGAQFQAAGLQPAGTKGWFQSAELTLLAPNLEGFSFHFTDGHHDIAVAPDEILLLTTAGIDLHDMATVKIDPDDRAVSALRPEDVAGKVALVKIIIRKDSEQRWQNMMQVLKKLQEMRPALVVNYGPNAAKVELPGIFESGGETPARAVPQMPVRTAALRNALEKVPSGPTPLRVSFHLAAPVRRRVQCRNVVGIVHGAESGPDARAIVVTANYDGMYPRRGEGSLPGANANASAIASLIETARILARSEAHPRRSILFAALFGEDAPGTGAMSGLGGKTYLGKPPMPPDKTDACIKLVQLGRRDAADGPHFRRLAITPMPGSPVPLLFAVAGKASGLEVYEDRAHDVVNQGRGFRPFLLASGVPSHTVYASYDFEGAYTVADTADKLDYANLAMLQKPLASALFAVADSKGAPAKSPFEGTWVLESPLVPRPLEAAFHVTGDEVTGSMKLGDGTAAPISAGKVQGVTISFRFQGLNGRTLVAKGTLRGDVVEFELLLPGNEFGSAYTAKRK